MQDINGKIMSKNRKVADVKSGIITIIDKQYAPLFFEKCSDITVWLKGRAIDSHRTNSRLLKKALRLNNKDDISTVLSVNAVTITDNYWFCENGSRLKWEDVKFSKNYFDMLALKGDPDSFNQEPSRTPELTNIGSFEKCWRLIDGKWLLYKSGNNNEYFSELFICKLGSALEFNMAHYELDGKFIRTPDFTENGKYNFEAADAIAGDDEDYKFNFNEFYKISESIAADYLRLIYLDTVCMNMDRHTKNYGVLRDAKTGKIVSLAPNYDNNIALISRGYPKNIERNNDLLISLFTEFLKNDKKAFEMFKNLNITKITEQMILNCISNIPIEVDEKYIIDFILNGQKKIWQLLS